VRIGDGARKHERNGWPIFRGGHQAIADMVAAFR
jgi:hypothetical protein